MLVVSILPMEPGLVLSPTSWACVADSMRDPGLRGLALGYMLSPTSWACVAAALRCCCVATQGFADLPGLDAVAHFVGLRRRLDA